MLLQWTKLTIPKSCCSFTILQRKKLGQSLAQSSTAEPKFKAKFCLFLRARTIDKYIILPISNCLNKTNVTSMQPAYLSLKLLSIIYLYIYIDIYIWYNRGFPDGSDGKESTCNAGDISLIPASGRSPGKGSGNSLQYSCLENSMDRGAWQTIVHGVAKS